MTPERKSRSFPVMDDKAASIPWDLIAPHEQQAQRNHGQSLKRLAERGGLSWCESLAVLTDRPWERMDQDEAQRRVREIVSSA